MSTLKKSDIAKSFSAAAGSYDQHAFVQKEIGSRLLERLDLIKQPPEIILDVGAGTGLITRFCQRKFPKSKIIGLDLAEGMLQFAKSKHQWKPWKNQPIYLGGDAEKLPLRNQSVDLIISNFTFQWCDNLKLVFAECQRVLKPNGMLFFSTLGPNTLLELRESWQKTDNLTHVNDFIDMHDIGDVLLSSNFLAPIMDMEMLTVQYQSVSALLQDLKGTGARNMNATRPKGCTPKEALNQMMAHYEQYKNNNQYPCTFEIIYGHACQAETVLYREKEGVIKIPGNKIPLLQNAF